MVCLCSGLRSESPGDLAGRRPRASNAYVLPHVYVLLTPSTECTTLLCLSRDDLRKGNIEPEEVTRQRASIRDLQRERQNKIERETGKQERKAKIQDIWQQ